MSGVLFASVEFDKYLQSATLPAKFERMLDKTDLADKVNGRHTAIKMHVGRETGYTTIHPIFVKILVDKLKSWGAKVFITDQTVNEAAARGYTESFLGCPIVDVCGLFGKYFYHKEAALKTFKDADIGGHIHDAEFLLNLSHVKGHGACGYGGACKNLAMGCVTDRTRSQLHRLEGGLEWDESKCIHCERCIESCNHSANSFDKNGKYNVFYHHCTFCQHCVKVCPTNAIALDGNRYVDFQSGMALCTKLVLDTFGPGNAYHINFLTDITAVCDCWGFSTPSVVPDIGVMCGPDLVAVERACIDAIKVENFMQSGLPKGHELGTKGHLFERIHARDPYVQLDELEKIGVGIQKYDITEIA